jgi:hypothetical protein
LPLNYCLFRRRYCLLDMNTLLRKLMFEDYDQFLLCCCKKLSS